MPLIIFIYSLYSFGEDQDIKGLLPEIKSNSNNEEINSLNSFNSEVLISKAELNAIDTLTKIIKKNKNPKEEVNLLFRLAELHNRRSKSGRYFDLDTNSEAKLKKHGLTNQKSQTPLREAIRIYDQIETKFSKYKDLDYVLFNSAMAHLQLKQNSKAAIQFTKLINQHPDSPTIPDALLEFGELLYNQQEYSSALEKFNALGKYTDSTAYPYGLYKSAWCFYNMKNTQAGINQLLKVLKQNPANSNNSKKYNLRGEALKDLTLFVGETLASDEVFSFFHKITTEQELGEVIVDLARLYDSHSRHKEISVFTKEFIKHYPKSKQAPICYVKMIDANETMKQRAYVLESLKEMSVFCQTNNNNQDCLSEFRKISLEITKKWWEIWIKNKNHVEFSDLTEKAFENLLSAESPAHPDLKSRFAYAELLFQKSKYTESANNYELISLKAETNAVLRHDSLYGALFSIEKLIENSELPQLIERQKNLSIRYISEFKNTEHTPQIQYKLAYLNYKQQQYDQALIYIKPLSVQIKNIELKLKAEDLMLDMFNITKNYKALAVETSKILKNTLEPKRREQLIKIANEAEYSQIQIDMKTIDIQNQIHLLTNYATLHKNTKLSQDAFWQAISLAYSNGFVIIGADLSQKFLNEYPNDTRTSDAINEALKAYVESAHIDTAITVLKDVMVRNKKSSIMHQELLCDLYKINNNVSEGKNCYKGLLSKLQKNEQLRLIRKIALNQISSDWNNSIENDSYFIKLILADNIEPIATQILIKQLRRLQHEKMMSEAFNLSLKINSREIDNEQKAEARLIQAEILEQEFYSQSVKAKVDKLALVISLKTEKLDKAFTAYSSTINMTTAKNIQLSALKGIDRLYSHYIDSLNNIPLPITLPENDRMELQKELVKLTIPFIDKKNSNRDKILRIAKFDLTGKSNLQYTNIENSPNPYTTLPEISKITQYHLKGAEYQNINQLLHDRKYADAKNAALKMTSTEKYKKAGLYYLSLIADQNAEYEKALWLIEKAEILIDASADNFSSYLKYQKAKVYFSVNNFDMAFKYFGEVLDSPKLFTECTVFSAIYAFSEGDYLKAKMELSRLSYDQNYNYGVDILHIDSVLMTGDITAAQNLLDKYSFQNKNRVEWHLEQAKLYESFKFDIKTALTAYRNALNSTSDYEQKNWLNRKIERLNLKINNQLTSYVGDQ